MRPEDLSLEPNSEQNLECQKGAEKTIKFVLKKSNEFKELLYIPKYCEECSLYKDQELRERIIGLKLQTPYSYLLLEGCNTDRVCEHKNAQLLYFGLGINTYIVEKFWVELWKILTGETLVKSRHEFVREVKKEIGFVEGETQKGKEIVIALPEIVNRMVQFLIEKKIACLFEYPVVGYLVTVINIDEGFKGKLVPLEEYDNISSREVFRIRLGYFTSTAYTVYDTVACFTKKEGSRKYGGSYQSNVDQVFIDTNTENSHALEELEFVLLLDRLIEYLENNIEKGLEVIEKASKIFKTRVILASFYSSKSI